MAVEVTLEIATDEHAHELAPRLREADALEVMASDGTDALTAIRESIDVSSEAWAIRFDGELALVFGVMPLCGDGVAWLLTTDLVERNPKLFWKLSRKMLLFLFERWDTLINAIDVRHEKAIRWAERLGMRLDPPAPFGAAGLEFRRFTVTREDLCVPH